MKWFVRFYGLCLLAYTGWRTWDFMMHQLPAQEGSVFLAVFFLFATEIGLLMWHETTFHATTATQEGIAIVMTWTCFVASLSAGIADMILRQTLVQSYIVPAWLVTLLIYGMPLVVALNVAAALIYLSNDAETQIKRGKRQIKFAAQSRALSEINTQLPQIAERLKTPMAATIIRETTGQIAKEYFREAAKTQQPTPPTPARTASSNGNGARARNYQGETEDATSTKGK